jgi:hypothetical protein
MEQCWQRREAVLFHIARIFKPSNSPSNVRLKGDRSLKKAQKGAVKPECALRIVWKNPDHDEVDGDRPESPD